MGSCFSAQTEIVIEDEEEIKEDNKGNTIDIQDFKIGRTLGTGASCKVVAAVNKKNFKQQVAIKIMQKDPTNLKLFNREINVLSRLCPPNRESSHHKNILQYIGYSEDESSHYIVTKLLEGGELFDRIVSKDDKYIITEKKAASLIYDMLTALKYCHDKHIVHRDLKPENFVFATKEVDSDIVLIDYGCACVVKDDAIMDNVVGTAYYIAPELACVAALKCYEQSGKSSVADRIPQPQSRTGRILKASDLWSIGVIAYVMMTGRAPFRKN